MVKMKYYGKRKIVKINETYYISIPKPILKKMTVRDGDEVMIFLTEDKRILISPVETEVEL